MSCKLICRICKANFSRVPCKAHGKLGNFCSRICYAAARHRKVIRKCLVCKSTFKAKRARVKAGEGFYCSKRCNAISRNGKRHPNWRGGISRLPYAFDFNDALKEQIRNRDSYECQLCSMSEEEHLSVHGCVLCVHHIDYNKMNSNPNNLTALCIACNFRVNYNRLIWMEFFKRKVAKHDIV